MKITEKFALAKIMFDEIVLKLIVEILSFIRITERHSSTI